MPKLRRTETPENLQLTGWQRLSFDISCASVDHYGPTITHITHFHSPEHRRAVWEANRDEIMADRDPQLAGRRPTAFWEYDFPAIYRARPHLDKWGLVRLDESGVPGPYQDAAYDVRQPDILYSFELLAATERLALRRMYPRGDEWGCPRFLKRSPPHTDAAERPDVIEMTTSERNEKE